MFRNKNEIVTLTVEFCDHIIDDALFGVRVFNGGIIVCDKVALNKNKAKCYHIWCGNRLYSVDWL